MSFFTSKSKNSDKEIIKQLGIGTSELVALDKNNPLFLMDGVAEISSTLANAKKYFGINIENGSVFSRYVNGIETHNIADLELLTCYMIDQLKISSDIEQRGRTLRSWFNKIY